VNRSAAVSVVEVDGCVPDAIAVSMTDPASTSLWVTS